MSSNESILSGNPPESGWIFLWVLSLLLFRFGNSLKKNFFLVYFLIALPSILLPAKPQRVTLDDRALMPRCMHSCNGHTVRLSSNMRLASGKPASRKWQIGLLNRSTFAVDRPALTNCRLMNNSAQEANSDRTKFPNKLLAKKAV